MSVDAHIPSSASQTFVFSIWYVLISCWINVFLSQPKVYYMNYMIAFGRVSSDQKVLRFYVSINEMLCVHIFHSLQLQQKSFRQSKGFTTVGIQAVPCSIHKFNFSVHNINNHMRLLIRRIAQWKG